MPLTSDPLDRVATDSNLRGFRFAMMNGSAIVSVLVTTEALQDIGEGEASLDKLRTFKSYLEAVAKKKHAADPSQPVEILTSDL